MQNCVGDEGVHFDDRNVRSILMTVNWSLMNSNKENLSLLLSFLGHVDLQECELDPGMP